MSQTTTEFDLDNILSDAESASPKTPTPWSKQEDDQLLKDLYALMGDIPEEPEKRAAKAAAEKKPEAPEPERKAAEAPAQPEKAAPKEPAAEPTPVQAAEKAAASVQSASKLPEQEPGELPQDGIQEDWEELPSERSAPGWLKGTFLFLISLLLCGMTLYAVAADVFGPLF